MRNLREYLWAKSPNEACELRCGRPGRGAYLGGGTALAARQDPNLDFVVDLSRAGLGEIHVRRAAIEIGATVTLEELLRAPEMESVGTLSEAARRTRTEPWRRQATLAGRLLEGDDSDLLAPSLLVLGGRVRCWSGPMAPPDTIDLEDFLERRRAAARGRDPQALDPLVLGIEILRPQPGSGFALEIVARSALDAPIAAVAVGIRTKGRAIVAARVATSALPVPGRARRTEAALGRSPAGEMGPALAAFADDIAPRDDWRASAEYRAHVAGVLLQRAVHRALTAAAGKLGG
jgi:carbon-monoxide dehydrogenase medium subunit